MGDRRRFYDRLFWVMVGYVLGVVCGGAAVGVAMALAYARVAR